MTTDEMIAFWSRLGGDTVHPEDDRTLLTVNGFETRLLPLPWHGPINSARVFVALLNPGLDPADVPYEERDATFCEHLRRNLQGDGPYLYFEHEYQDHPGAHWARETFGPDWREIGSKRICVIQLVAYHAVDGRAPKKVSHRLRSTAVLKGWVQRTLLPRVRAGDALLIVGRGSV